jgi:glycosyltransferase involved in cell wall biosynthesis
MNATSPEVSVVLPVYNGAGTIAATIASVLRQTHGSFELLVIDDGSTDDTVRIAGSFRDPRIAVHSFENRGLAASRNRGVRLARGEFIGFIDADDLWTEHKLARQVEALRRDPAAGLAYSFTDCIDEHDAYLGPGSHIAASGRVYEKLLVWNFLDSGSCALVRASALADAGMFDESLPAAEDWDLWLRLAWGYPFACVPWPDVLYRVHSSAMSSSIRRQEQACLRVFSAAVNRLPAGARRDELRREGIANLNRYFTGRVLGTSSGPASGRLAARYWWRYLTAVPARSLDLRWATFQAGRIALTALLPAAVSRPLIGGLRRLWVGRSPGAIG